MKLSYDPQSDTLVIRLRKAHVADSDEIQPGLIVDLDDDGKVVAIEVLRAATHMDLSEGVTMPLAAAAS